MTTVLSAFCEAIGFPDPHALLVERARSGVSEFRQETAAALWRASYYRAGLSVHACATDMFRTIVEGLVTDAGKPEVRPPGDRPWLAEAGLADRTAEVGQAIAHVRALSEALGHPLAPSSSEELSVAQRIAKLVVEMIGAPPYDVLMVVWYGAAKDSDLLGTIRKAGAAISAAGPDAIDRARELVEELSGCSFSPDRAFSTPP